jgi:hypothetical protein
VFTSVMRFDIVSLPYICYARASRKTCADNNGTSLLEAY